jgi:PAS domain S-box-containing protein
MTDAPRPASEPAGWQAAFRLLFDTSVTPVAILDGSRRLLDMNPAGLRLLCLTATPLAGERAEGAIARPERERSEADWRQLLRQGSLSGTRTLIRADGAELKVMFAAVVESVAGARRAIYTFAPADGEPVEAEAEAGLCSDALTAREAQVVQLIAGGLDTSEIAATLLVSPNTVRSHVRNAMSKLGARTRAQLVAQVLGGEEARRG